MFNPKPEISIFHSTKNQRSPGHGSRTVYILYIYIIYWLVALTFLNNFSQWEGLSHTLWNIKFMFETTKQYIVLYGKPKMDKKSGETWEYEVNIIYDILVLHFSLSFRGLLWESWLRNLRVKTSGSMAVGFSIFNYMELAPMAPQKLLPHFFHNFPSPAMDSISPGCPGIPLSASMLPASSGKP